MASSLASSPSRAPSRTKHHLDSSPHHLNPIPPVEIDEFLLSRVLHSSTQPDREIEDEFEDNLSPPPIVEILGARGLHEATWAGWGRSLRFCTCEVPGKPGSRVQEYRSGDTLLFTVVATHAKFKKWRACLGTASLQCDKFEISGSFDGELPLCEERGPRKAFLHVKVVVPKRPEPEKAPVALPEDTQPKPKRRLKPGEQEPRPVAVPSIIERCLQEAKVGAEKIGQAKEQEQTAAEEGSVEDVRCVEDLPPGWEAAWDETHKRYYFYNHDLGTSSWEWPT